MEKTFAVYIMASRTRVLYTGVTGSLWRRVREHKAGEVAGFTEQYRAHRLVHYEQYSRPRIAVVREKEIKGWRREKKVTLIEAQNPGWKDLSEGWFEAEDLQVFGSYTELSIPNPPLPTTQKDT